MRIHVGWVQHVLWSSAESKFQRSLPLNVIWVFRIVAAFLISCAADTLLSVRSSSIRSTIACRKPLKSHRCFRSVWPWGTRSRRQCPNVVKPVEFLQNVKTMKSHVPTYAWYVSIHSYICWTTSFADGPQTRVRIQIRCCCVQNQQEQACVAANVNLAMTQ